jgi:NADPH-dependent 2,4-dienoyl-CoA reductase/sulfur reductase-like enzyme
VRVNFVGPEEFRRADNLFCAPLNVRSKNAAARWLPAKLGFNCGMRPSEVYGFRLGDVVGQSQLEILMQRESIEYDVLIVGGGPAGPSAAIRLKQLAAEKKNAINVCRIDKGSEIGGHILSGAVMEGARCATTRL